MAKTALEQLNALKADFEAKAAQIKDNALSELREQLKEAKATVASIEAEIAELDGNPVEISKEGGKRLKPIEEGGEEWNKVAGQIKIVLKNYKDGLNGKAIAKKLGLTVPKEIKRVQPVILGTARREGQGVSTRFFLK